MGTDKKSRIMDFDVMLKALLQAHKNIKSKKYGYNGPLLTSLCLLVGAPNLDQTFNKEKFEEGINEHDDTPMGRLLSAAIRIGIQQGIYMCSEEPTRHLEIEDFDELIRQIPVMKQIAEVRKSRKG